MSNNECIYSRGPVKRRITKNNILYKICIYIYISVGQAHSTRHNQNFYWPGFLFTKYVFIWSKLWIKGADLWKCEFYKGEIPMHFFESMELKVDSSHIGHMPLSLEWKVFWGIDNDWYFITRAPKWKIIYFFHKIGSEYTF